MSVLIIKNIENEGPGTIEEFLREKGMAYSILNMNSCTAEIPDVKDYSHLVILGGPLAIYNIDNHPFLHFEAAITRAFIKSNKPVLGICLGAQMIAYAIGAHVYQGASPEVGWYKVNITAEGMNDPLMSSLAVNDRHHADVFQWHGDTFDLHKNAVRIASSDVFENQAFRYGDKVYALQFHIEVTPEMIREWFEKEEGYDVDAMVNQARELFPEYRKRAFAFYESFFMNN
ncbi:MAG: gamma-glutamyl-gamma-aminobutyrate hydrolase family protein [Nitrospiraceae bacterium]|nr:MAG: gamma-glutamyl-gamma-aminobutyrate hydrolase family protein [Nitrospiraceae bacterium]UCH46033.1 MAG: gamma-glutamyl-gamma-aminobutyrate hydrolase family protein [Nitrospiraceae bacterium]